MTVITLSDRFSSFWALAVAAVALGAASCQRAAAPTQSSAQGPGTSTAAATTPPAAPAAPAVPETPAPATPAKPAGPTAAEAVQAQWYLKDPQLDKVPGTGATRTYAELLRGRTPAPVVVAVIDSGVDTAHVDLKSVLWTNPREIPGNNVDDDKNGYVDDVHGWNFLGGPDGRNLDAETLESTRILAKLEPRFRGKTRQQVPAAQLADFNLFQKVKKSNAEKRQELTGTVAQIEQMNEPLQLMISALKQDLGVQRLDTATLRTAQPKDPRVARLARGLNQNLRVMNVGDTDALLAQLQDGLKTERDQLEVGLNPKYNGRADIVKDNPDDVTQRYYGNADVTGPDALHGTHVAGIIAAARGNNVGVDGIAGPAVRIMSVRAVPNGDERDKDVANAIRYAVDNGAQIVNMSFGKEFSPQRAAVEAAYKYAEAKGVLLVHAAGNEDDNLDVTPHYPAATYRDGKVPTHLLTVGASGPEANERLAAEFSNYSKRQVDLFAPGVGIFSTLPGSNYGTESGTSMAAPVVAGVAATLKSYFPKLSAPALKRIIRQSAQVHHVQVAQPGSGGKMVDFATLSSTGGVVDLYEAVKLALAEEQKQP